MTAQVGFCQVATNLDILQTQMRHGNLSGASKSPFSFIFMKRGEYSKNVRDRARSSVKAIIGGILNTLQSTLSEQKQRI